MIITTLDYCILIDYVIKIICSKHMDRGHIQFVLAHSVNKTAKQLVPSTYRLREVSHHTIFEHLVMWSIAVS